MSKSSNIPSWYAQSARAGTTAVPSDALRLVGLSEATTASALSATGRNASVPRRLLWLLDFLTLAVAFLCAYALLPLLHWLVAPSGGLLRTPWLEWLRLPTEADLADWRPLSDVVWMFAVMVPTTLLFVQMLGGYRPILEQSRARMVLASLFAPLAGLGTVALVIFALKFHHASRLLMFSIAFLSATGCLTHRTLIRGYKRRRLQAGRYAHDIAMIGPTAALELLVGHFDRHVSRALYRVAGHLRLSPLQTVSVGPDGGMSASSPGRLPVLGDVSELGDVLIHRPIHEILVVLSGRDEGWLRSVTEACDYFRVTLRIIPEALLMESFRDLTLPRSGPLQLPQIVFTPRHLDSDALFVKRAIDIVVSATLLAVLSPLFVLIAAAIKLTTPRLSVFYPWRVIGYKGRPFTGYKFTTMAADADERKTELIHLNEMTGPVFKIKDDPRVTRFGRFLRKYSLNELPQLWSVLKGDMSLVGPRPAGPHELPRYELWHKRKLAVQPGVTCLWQVRGRNQISNFDEWVRMDLEYIDHWSLWLDIRILLRTAWVVVAGTGS